ncbi:hypothetical protein [uncultured Croceitalea sp.]|uniref:hypothetical protein n=1 Tax=uncultured Croceitalea sp. TaxID=1798908 RepID=UPI0033064234
MKIITRYIPITNGLLPIMAIFLLTINVSQAQGNAERLIGSWQFSTETSFSKMNQNAAERMGRDTELQQKIRAAYIGKTIAFMPDGSYAQVLGNGQKASGKWAVDKNMVRITVADGSAFYFRFQIVRGTLLLRPPNTEKTAQSIVPDQYFTKI